MNVFFLPEVKYIIILLALKGALAQLARAPRWQRGGQEFESPKLHKLRPVLQGGVLFYIMRGIYENLLLYNRTWLWTCLQNT